MSISTPSSVRKLKFLRTLKNLRGASKAVLPADSRPSMKGRAEPSRMGTSGPSNSRRALSIPRAYKAASTCSVVWMVASPDFNVVPRRVSLTLDTWAGISGAPSRSVRTKT